MAILVKIIISRSIKVHIIYALINTVIERRYPRGRWNAISLSKRMKERKKRVGRKGKVRCGMIIIEIDHRYFEVTAFMNSFKLASY